MRIQWTSAAVSSGTKAMAASKMPVTTGCSPPRGETLDRPFDVIRDVMAPAAGGLGDGRIEQVGADRNLRGHADIHAPPPTPVRPTRKPTPKPAPISGKKPAAQPRWIISAVSPWLSQDYSRLASFWNFFWSSDFDEDGISTERSKIAASCARRWNSARSAGESLNRSTAPRQQLPVEHEDIVADGRGASLGPANDAAGGGGASTALTRMKFPVAGRSAKRSSDVARPSRMRQSAISLAEQAWAGVDAKVSKSMSAETLMLVTGVRSVAVRKR